MQVLPYGVGGSYELEERFGSDRSRDSARRTAGGETRHHASSDDGCRPRDDDGRPHDGADGAVADENDAVHPATPARSQGRTRPHPRSEEHTSELQSQSNLVCRLLLEKKNTYSRTLILL